MAIALTTHSKPGRGAKGGGSSKAATAVRIMKTIRSRRRASLPRMADWSFVAEDVWYHSAFDASIWKTSPAMSANASTTSWTTPWSLKFFDAFANWSDLRSTRAAPHSWHAVS